MTTEQIRKNITVTDFRILNNGIYIDYWNKPLNVANFQKTLNLTPIQAITELEKIGSIKRFDANPMRIWWDSPKGAACDARWEQFCTTFILSQYEAITLVVRHEYEQSLKSDMNLLELDKTLEALR
jgi:hypothetical protein